LCRYLAVNTAAAAFVADQSALVRLAAIFDRGGGGGRGRGGGGRDGGGGRGGGRGGGGGPPSAIQRLEGRQWKEAHATFKGVKVELTHFPGQRRRKLCRGLSKLSAKDLTFTDDQNRKVSVAEYFLKAHNKRLQFPDLPCVICGSGSKPTYFPLEVGESDRCITDSTTTDTASSIRTKLSKLQGLSDETQLLIHIYIIYGCIF